MNQIVALSFSSWTLPITVLLIVVLLYWVTVILGVLDLEFLDLDLNADLDADLDIDADIDLDTDMDLDADMDGGSADIQTSGGLFFGFLRFIHIGDVPFMIIFSSLVLVMWVCSILSRHYLSGSGWLWGLALFVGSFVLSMIATKFLTWPIRNLFSRLNKDHGEAIKPVGKICTVVMDVSGDRLGQAELETDGAPLLLNVKAWKDSVLKKGELGVIIQYEKNENLYMVKPFGIKGETK